MRIPWQVNTVAAAACSGVGLADLALHEWWGVPVLATSAGLNVWVSHRNYGRQHPPEAPHRPDYAKIRRLELELGMRDPDPPPVTEPVVPMFKPTLTPLEQAGEHWVNDANAALRQAQAEAAKWQQCPVCLRCHAGRCAG